jgi:ATP-dependent Lhr-like helicase
MARPDPGKRAPLWLQRLRAKDLLQVARQFRDFPIVVETVRECLDDDLELPRLRALLQGIQAGEIRVVRRQGEIPSPFTSELIFLFTAAHLYEWDEPRRSDRGPDRSLVDDDLLSTLLQGGNLRERIDPKAVGRLENRLRGSAHLPRTTDEMAEYLRRYGDLSPPEIADDMLALLEELQRAQRAVIFELSGTREPRRWVLAEEESRYRSAFPSRNARSNSEDDAVRSPAENEARAAIVQRFLGTRALIGLADLTDRYPISAADATELLETWTAQGSVVKIDESEGQYPDQWSNRENLAEMLRVSVALRRRESLAVAPEVFADFLLRYQHIHPNTRGEGCGFVERILDQMQGHPASAPRWESELLPSRIIDYRPAWLDDALGRGDWLWRAGGDGGDAPAVAFFHRDFAGNFETGDNGLDDLAAPEREVLDLLDRHGASFVADLCRRAKLEPTRVRRALEALMRRSLVTNDRFEPMRPGSQAALQSLDQAALERRAGGSLRRAPRRPLLQAPEGRWSRLELGSDDTEAGLLAWAAVLLGRYGVLTREILNFEPWAPAWSDLVRLLGRAEWRGEIRRGYFVEGLSGVQYATDEAATELVRLSADSEHSDPLVWVAASDPANLYGSGAPFDIELLDGGSARLPRLPGHSLVLRRGRPVLIIESFGKRLTSVPWASQTDIESSLKFLLNLTGPGRRILKLETYNAIPVATSAIASCLSALGFVRDFPGMAYYFGMPSANAAAAPLSHDLGQGHWS